MPFKILKIASFDGFWRHLLDEQLLQIQTNLTTEKLYADEGTVVKGAENILRYIL